MGNRDVAVARRYHEETCHSEASLRANAHALDWDNRPIPFKLYRDLEAWPLPRDAGAVDAPALEAVTQPGGARHRPDLRALARVLGLAAGITKHKRYPGGEVYFRAYPNTGALYHIDVYLACAELPGLPAGVYHFGPHDFALRRLRAGDHRAVLVDAAGGEPALAAAPAVLASASTYWRNAWKYRARAYRHCFWDAGTLHANLLAAAGAESLGPRVVVGFADRAAERLLGLDPAREGALTLVPLGRGADPAPPAPALEPLALDTEPLSREEVDYPEIRELHAASSLESGDEAAAWRAAVYAPRAEQAAARTELPAPARPPASLERVIRRRGSTRAFDPSASLTAAELATALDCAAAPLAADFLAGDAGSLVDLYVIAHAVDGVEPGAYRYRPAARALEPVRKGDLRAAAGRLALFQPLAADAAANVYALADLDRVLDAFGNRGYRAAQLEGGIRGGRMYLAAYAQGCGATGLTFLDHEVTELFDATGRSPMFLVALGRSAQRSRA